MMARLMLQVVVAVGLLGAVLAAPPPPCTTAACKEIASTLKNSMNSSVDPCEDFYAYSCSGWVAAHPIPDWKSATGVTEELEELQRGQIQKILENFNLTTDVQNNSASVSLSAYLYQKCIQLGNEPANVGLKQFGEVVKKILGGEEWQIGQEVRSPDDSKWEDVLTKMIAFGGIDAVFSVAIAPDPKNVSTLVLNLDPAPLGLGPEPMLNMTAHPKLINAYKTLISKSAKLLCGNACNSSRLESDIEEILQFESALAKAQKQDENDEEVLSYLTRGARFLTRRSQQPLLGKHKWRPSRSLTTDSAPGEDLEETYVKLTLDELKAKTNFDWLNRFLRPLWKSLGVSSHIDGNTWIMFSDLEYLQKAVQILDKTSPRVLHNYLGWLAVDENSPFAAEVLRELAFDFAKVTQGITRRSERSRTCLNLVNSQLNWALGRLFVDQHFSLAEKQEATTLIDQIQAAFIQLLGENTWLDAKTKAASLSKLKHVRKNVAYPQWLLDNGQLDRFHALENGTIAAELLGASNYLLSNLQYSLNSIRRNFDVLNEPIEVDKSWPMGPYIVNAAYVPEQNSITIPAGQLKSPFFNHNFPFALNFGNIGAIVGHELTHGLDDEGRQFDETGNLHNWWTEEAAERFNNRSQCFVKQYGGVTDETTGLKLKGDQTLGENLADGGGLHEAYRAYKNYEAKRGPSPPIADLLQHTSDQLFFLSYAYSWCSNVRPQALRNQIENDVHAPERYRVNVVVGNSAEFARAYRCPVGSPMNRPEKCLLW